MSETMHVVYSGPLSNKNTDAAFEVLPKSMSRPKRQSPYTTLKAQPPPIGRIKSNIVELPRPSPTFPRNKRSSKKSYTLQSHARDLTFDLEEMWLRGTTKAIINEGHILERKLHLALERVGQLEDEVEHLRSINRALEEKCYQVPTAISEPSNYEKPEDKGTYYHEYWFMCRQYTELQKRYFSRGLAIKENTRDAGVQCDLMPIISAVPPVSMKHPARLRQNNSTSNISSLVSQNSIQNARHKNSYSTDAQGAAPIPPRHPFNQKSLDRPTVAPRIQDKLAVARTLSGEDMSKSPSSEDERMLHGQIMDMSSKKWLNSFKAFQQAHPFSRPTSTSTIYDSLPGSPSSGSDTFDQQTLVDFSTSPLAGEFDIPIVINCNVTVNLSSPNKLVNQRFGNSNLRSTSVPSL